MDERDPLHEHAEPGGREPAPGELALVQDFINTVDIESGEEELGSPEELRRWLAVRGLLGPGGSVGEGDLLRAIGVREALRALALAHNGDPVDRGAVRTLNRAAEHGRLRVAFDEEGSADLEPGAPGVDGALGILLGAVYRATAEGTWPRLKACRSDVCRWAFYDHSKNRSGAWCSMRICGSRSKARAYRERRRADA